jgi:hypothetical protein
MSLRRPVEAWESALLLASAWASQLALEWESVCR